MSQHVAISTTEAADRLARMARKSRGRARTTRTQRCSGLRLFSGVVISASNSHAFRLPTRNRRAGKYNVGRQHIPGADSWAIHEPGR